MISHLSEDRTYLSSIVDDTQEAGKVSTLAFLGHSYGKAGCFFKNIHHTPDNIYSRFVDESVLKRERGCSVR